MAPVLSTIPEVDALWSQYAGNNTRSGNINVLPSSDGGEAGVLPICHIPFVAGALRNDVPKDDGLRVFEVGELIRRVVSSYNMYSYIFRAT